MNTGKIFGISLSGIACAVPQQKEKNEDLTWIAKQEQHSLQEAIGVKERCIAQKQSLYLLFERASEALLKGTKTDRKDIAFLLLVTQTSPLRIPSMAFVLQNALKLAECNALEVNWGCAGYVYGLWLAGQLLQGASEGKKALLLTGDLSTQCLAERDQSTIPLFSDAVSATLLSKQKKSTPWHFYLGSDATKHSHISMKTQNPSKKDTLHMNGMEVFQFALRKVLPNLQKVLQNGPWTMKDINYFVFHQASYMINEALRQRLGIDPAHFPYSLREWGNTSSASIPMTLLTELGQKTLGKRQKMLLCGFGTGLSWGILLLESKHVKVIDLQICKA